MSSKLREALNQLLGLIDNEILVFSNELDPSEVSNAQYQIDKADEALAEPLRNCDVGTAEEQGERFILFCRRNSFRGVCNDSCKFANVNRRLVWQKIGQARCFPFWAQMPYESSELTKTTETKTNKGE